MNTQHKILHAIQRYVDKHPQINLESDSAQDSLAEYIYLTLMKQTDELTETHNEQQLHLFSNIDNDMPK